MLLEHPPDLDRPCGRVTAVRVDEERCVVAERCAHGFDDRLGAARPFVLVVAALLADAHLERVEPVAVTETTRRAASSSGVMSRRMLDAYAAKLRASPPRSSHTPLPSSLPRRSQSAVSTPASARIEMRAAELVLAVLDLADESRRDQRVATERVRRDLAVEHFDGGVRVVRERPGPTLRLRRPCARGRGRRRWAAEALDARRSSSAVEDDHVAQRRAVADSGDRLVDPLERIARGDQLVELQTGPARRARRGRAQRSRDGRSPCCCRGCAASL